MLALLFGAISLLYATVGQAGGTSFLALMALASFSPSEMRSTALMLNIVASTYSRRHLRRANPKRLSMALCSRRLGGGHDWDNRGAALVVANDDALPVGSNSLCGRDPTFGFLRPLSRLNVGATLLQSSFA
jgi:hypothetical protein